MVADIEEPEPIPTELPQLVLYNGKRVVDSSGRMVIRTLETIEEPDIPED